jgi:hypothetical protein
MNRDTPPSKKVDVLVHSDLDPRASTRMHDVSAVRGVLNTCEGANFPTACT